MAGEIFISYRRVDQAKAKLLHDLLKQRGVDAWYDALLDAGDDWRNKTANALVNAPIFVLLFSKAASESDDISKELAAATFQKKTVIPVRIEDIHPEGAFLYELASRNWYDAFHNTEARFEELADKLAALVKGGADAKTVAASIGMPAPRMKKRRGRSVFAIGGLLVAALAITMPTIRAIFAPDDNRQTEANDRLTAFFGFTAAGEDAAVATMAGDANAETYRTFAALGLETASEASTSNVPLAEQLETAEDLNARYAVGGEVRKTASGFDITLRIDDTQRRKTLWRETLSGSEKDTIVLPVAAAEQAGGTIRCLNRMFKDIPNPSEDLMAALPRACATRRLASEDRVQAWRAAATLAPDSPAVLAMVASSLSALSTQSPPGTREQLRREAVEVLTRALRLEPGLRDARANLAINEGKDAADLNRRIAGLPAAAPGDVEPVEPGVPDMLEALGLMTVGRFADAIPILRQAVQADSLFHASNLWLAASLIENGQTREGREIYERAITQSASPFYWNSWAMQELSNPTALAHALEMAPPGIAADTTDCLRSLAGALAEKRPEARARSAWPALACMRRTGPQFLLAAASALGDLDEAFAAADQAETPQLFILHLTVTRTMRADPRFLPLMKKSGIWQHWVTTKTMPDWCKLPQEQGFETCVALRAEQAQ